MNPAEAAFNKAYSKYDGKTISLGKDYSYQNEKGKKKITDVLNEFSKK